MSTEDENGYTVKLGGSCGPLQLYSFGIYAGVVSFIGRNSLERFLGFNQATLHTHAALLEAIGEYQAEYRLNASNLSLVFAIPFFFLREGMFEALQKIQMALT